MTLSEMQNAIERYEKWYRSRPFLWRVFNEIRWRIRYVICAITGAPTPGENALLRVIKDMENEAKN